MSIATAWAAADLAALTASGLRRELEPLASPQGAVVQIGNERLTNFSSNDYLGLANDPRIARAAREAIDRFGVGAGASRLVAGDFTPHHALETALAEFQHTEAVRLFNNGYSVNSGSLGALVGEDDAIFSDERNHASLIDGCRLSRARTLVYPHNDVDALDKLLRTTSARRRIICTESVFSMDGDLAPLDAIAALAERHGAALYIDEAHAIGVHGPRGEGLCEALGLAAQVDVRVGTLGKSLGAFGAFAATSRPVADLLMNRARSFVYSTALPPALCAAATCAVEIVRTDDSLREKLWRNVRRFAEGLSQRGFAASTQSPIFPIVIGDATAAMNAAAALRKRGILAKAIRPPTVPPGTSRLRMVISAAHSEAEIEVALEALGTLRSLPLDGGGSGWGRT